MILSEFVLCADADTINVSSSSCQRFFFKGGGGGEVVIFTKTRKNREAVLLSEVSTKAKD